MKQQTTVHKSAAARIPFNAPFLPLAMEFIDKRRAVLAMATIGGNIATASPVGDSLPSLYLLAAVLKISAANGSRMLPIDQFICRPRKTVLQPGEIVSRIILTPAGE